MSMRQQNWWNSSFEDMMAELGQWLADHEAISIVHLDWKFVQRPNENDGYWYMLLIFK